MLVTPLPGTNRGQLLQMLREIHTAAYNLRAGGGPSGTAQDRITAYLQWVTDTLQRLSSQVVPTDLARLVLTPGYSRLLSSAGTMTGTDIGTQRALNGMVSLELTERVAAFEAAVQALDAQIHRWSATETFLAADTSFYIQHPTKLAETNFGRLFGLGAKPTRLLVPILVVDELDGLKKSKDRHERWRAGYTLAALDRLFTVSTEPASLVCEDADGPSSSITIELLLDPPGHIRLPINDDELVDRVATVQPLTGQSITLLTYDTSQSMRARSAGLTAFKLTKPLPDEPADSAN